MFVLYRVKSSIDFYGV